MDHFLHRLCGLGIWVAVTGCAAGPTGGVEDLVGFLRDGRTTRSEVAASLGKPSGSFESGRLLTYRVGYDGAGRCFRVVPRPRDNSGWPDWQQTDYSLVLVFEGNRLRRHALVRIK